MQKFLYLFIFIVFITTAAPEFAARQPDFRTFLTGKSEPSLFADGDLDTTFGINGLAQLPLVSGSEVIGDVVLQPDWKTVAVGETDGKITLARYDTNGVLDPTFGTNGVVLIFDVNFFDPSFDSGNYGLKPQVALQPDGKIVVTGNIPPNLGALTVIRVLRFNADGTPDAGFGTNGKLSISFPNIELEAHDIAVQTDGKIVIGCEGSEGDNGNFSVLRLNSNGSLDTGFSGDGLAGFDPYDVDSEFRYTQPHAIAVQPDGKIIAAGGRDFEITDFVPGEFVLVRFNADGSVDAGFGNGGFTYADFANEMDKTALEVEVQTDGKIIAAGYSFVPGGSEPLKKSAIARFNPNGGLDATFSGGGMAILDTGGFNEFRNVEVQTDGKIVAVGANNILSGAEDFSVVRLHQDGSLDTTFDTDGKVSTDFFTRRDQAFTALLQPDGKIIAAGLTTTWNQGRNFALARYNSDGSLDASFGAAGKTDSVTQLRTPQFSEAGVQSNGKIVIGGSIGGVPILARYNANGTLDPTFGVNGTITGAFDNVLAMTSATGIIEPRDNGNRLTALEITADDRIVAVGYSGPRPLHFTLARYTANGLPDPTFGANGEIMSAENLSNYWNAFEGLYEAVVQPDGKIVTASGVIFSTDTHLFNFNLRRYNADGSRDNSYFYTTNVVAVNHLTFTDLAVQADGKVLASTLGKLLRLNLNGQPDLCFGEGGFAATNSLPNFAFGQIAVQADGRILSAGSNGSNAAMIRIEPDGAIDTTFGSGGTAPFSIRVGKIVALANGKILLGGWVNTGNTSDSAISRLNPDGSPDGTFGSGGTVIRDFNNGGSDFIFDLEVQPDGKIVSIGHVLARFLGDSPPAAFTPTAPTGFSDIAVTGTATPNPAQAGLELTYRATVTNVGTNQATSVKIGERIRQTDLNNAAVPVDFTVESATATQGSCVVYDFFNSGILAEKIVVCSLGNLAPGASATVTVKVKPFTNNRNLINTIQTHTCGQVDLNYANNRTGFTTRVEQPRVNFVRPGTSLPQSSIMEGNSGTKPYEFLVQLSGAAGVPVSVNYATVNGSATAPSDFTAASGTLTFAPGETLKTIVVQINGDTLPEGSGTGEDFTVVLSTPVNALLGEFPTHFANIRDEDTSNLAIATEAPLIIETGSRLTYHINFSVGTTTRNGVVISAPVPSGTSFVSATNGGALSGSTVTYNLGTINGGSGIQTVSLTVNVTTPAGTSLASNNFRIQATGATTRTALPMATLVTPVAVAGRTPFDFDGDGRADLSVFRPGTDPVLPDFFLRLSASNQEARFSWGLPGDKLAPADYDDDGKTDYAVWREYERNFYIYHSSNGTVRVENFGLEGDHLTVGDWDGDGKADLSIYRPGAQSYFFYRGSLNNPAGNITYLPWGIAEDKPVRGDFDGDGKQDLAVFRPSNAVWYIQQSSNGQVRYENWGLASDRFVAADYDGDGKTDLAVYRDGTWYIRQSSNNQPRYEYFGLASDVPVPADYDGDGRADVAVFRNGTWYVKRSTGGLLITQFGIGGDSAVPAAFINP